LGKRCPGRGPPGHAKHAAGKVEPDRSATSRAEAFQVRAGPTSRIEHPLPRARVELPECVATIE
jgi:hypothetical protein